MVGLWCYNKLMKDLEKMYKALANRRRLTAIKFLRAKREASVGEIAEHLKLSFKSTSRHIAVLRNADIVEKEQRGLLAFYSLSSDVHPIIKQLLSMV